MSRPPLFRFDFLLFGATVALMIVGILFVYSSNLTSEGTLLSREYLKQIFWVATGIILALMLAFSPLKNFKEVAIPGYILGNVLLFITLLWGREVQNSRSWLGLGPLGIQPSEFVKLTTILMLAYFLQRRQKQINSLSSTLLGLLIVALPIGLILLQPDFGTAMVFFPLFLATGFMAGTPLRHLLFFVLAGGIAVLGVAYPFWAEKISSDYHPFANLLAEHSYLLIILLFLLSVLIFATAGYFIFKKPRVYYWIIYGTSATIFGVTGALFFDKILKEYQLMRLISFLDPYVDPQGAGWNIIQSVTAVGSGGIYGKGFLMGTQSHYRYLPKQSTDFIFSVVSEETGFLGALIIFFLYGVILFRCLVTAYKANERFESAVTAGIAGILFFHIVENIGMAIGVMPVVGIPLPFLSYGGSSLWASTIAIGCVLNFQLSAKQKARK